MTAPFEIRFSHTASTFWLSPLAHQNAEAVMWLEPIVYKPLNLPAPERYERLFQVLGDIGRKYGGKPHIAKPQPSLTSSEKREMYSCIDDWNDTVRKVDPEGMFRSEWLQRQYGLDNERDQVQVKGKEA